MSVSGDTGGYRLPSTIKLMMAFVVPFLRCADGIETFESCQGGDGHAYPSPQ